MGESEEAITLKIIVIGMAVIFTLSLAVIVFFILYQRKLLAQQKRHQEKETRYQKELLETSILSQERERNRIAKELHDDVGALLTTTKLYFNQITPDLPKSEIISLTDRSLSFLDTMIESVRTISRDLRPVILEKMGLIEAVQSLVQSIQDTGAVRISFNYQPIQSLSKSRELNCYRIVQELLNNTLKHANASRILINIKTEKEYLVIAYEDDGKGYNPDTEDHVEGLGFKNIKSRLSVVSGKFYFPSTQKGFRMSISIPYDAS
ncbi:sensor histidine kinase [Aquimarina sp. 2-A2]|uniref:sensor histidine kinase n=1 Tax=Aquimarina sp. 2-A2 TaxID=3382644 RepID=UPI00387EFFE0